MKTKTFNVGLAKFKILSKKLLYITDSRVVGYFQTCASSAFFWYFGAWHEDIFFFHKGEVLKSADTLYEYYRIFIGLNFKVLHLEFVVLLATFILVNMFKYKENTIHYAHHFL